MISPRPHAASGRARLAGSWRGVLAVLVVATVLRPSVVVVGPVLPLLREQLGLGAGAAALLTALPVVCFGVGAFLGPVLSRRIGVDAGLTGALALLVVGSGVRVLGGSGWLFLGTAALGIGIAVGNVLLPAVVRRDFADRVGSVTGLYTSTLSLFAAVAALTAVPVAAAAGGSWRAPLGLWGVLAVVALLLRLAARLAARVRARPGATTRPDPTTDRVRPALAGLSLGLLRSRTARDLTLFMGLQSIGFYAMVAWLPTLLQDAGVPATTSGALLSLATVLGIPMGLVLPVVAARLTDQRGVAVSTTAFVAAGWLGLLIAPAAAPLLWSVLLGIGTGSTFPLALLLIALRSPDPAVTPPLSATVQGLGYLGAAAGPFAVGVLHETTGSWAVPLLLLLALTAVQAVGGWAVGRPRPL